MLDLPILSFLIWLPVFGGLGVLVVGDRGAKQFALGVALVTFLLSLPLYAWFNPVSAGMQFVEKYAWIETFKIDYHLGVDGISMPLILLNTFITVLVVIAGWEVVKYRVSQYMAAFLIMEGIVNGVFAALDAMLFYILFEGMLIPLFLIIGIWGGARRVYATIKFFLYTFFGSVFLLISLIYLYQLGGSFDVASLQRLSIERTPQILIFLSFLLAFGVKVPMWPVHTWLPDAHVEAPTGGSVILAAITLKVGGYAFLRFAMPIVPDAAAQLDWLVLFMSLTAVVYIGFVALVQQDMKKLVAYSSIAHMGFVTLGFFIIYGIADVVQKLNPIVVQEGVPPVANKGIVELLSTGQLDAVVMGIQGAMVQMVSHGFISGAMFLCIGVLYDRMHTRDINAYGGVVNKMPQFAALYVLFAMANTGLPGTSGFVGEFMVILASFKYSAVVAFLAATTLIVGAAYTLWLVKRVLFGEIKSGEVAELRDINSREFVMLALLAGAVLLLGLWPQPLTDVMDASIRQLIPYLLQSKIAACAGMSVEVCSVW